MIAALISSSVLIAVPWAARPFLAGRVSPRLRYGLWGLAALRLFVPFCYPLRMLAEQFHSRFSVMEAARLLRDRAVAGTDWEYLADNLETGHVYTFTGTEGAESLARRAAGIDWQLWIMVVWVLGSLAVFVWIIYVNRRFWHFLRERRRRFTGKLPAFARGTVVYLVPGLASPCCFGLGREKTAVYLPEKLEGESLLVRYALAHELAHIAQGDRYWGYVRCALLCFYWFDPFVWAAAAFSRRDCELACDEAAVTLLGEEERFHYGRALLELAAAAGGRGGIFCTTISMAGGKREFRELVKALASRSRMSAAAAVVAVLCALGLAACAFAGSAQSESIRADAERETGEIGARIGGDGRVSRDPAGSLVSGYTLEPGPVRRSGNFYEIELRLVDGETGEGVLLPPDGGFEVEVTAFEDEAGTVPAGGKSPSQGYGTSFENENNDSRFVVEIWNWEHAAAYRIHALTREGAAEYLFPVGNGEQYRASEPGEPVTGPDGSVMEIAYMEEYEDACALRLEGNGVETFLNSSLLLEAGEGVVCEPRCMNRNNDELYVLFDYGKELEEPYAEKRLIVHERDALI